MMSGNQLVHPKIRLRVSGIVVILTDQTTWTPVPAVTTRQGETVDVSVKEESWSLPEPILKETKIYGEGLDPVKLQAGMQKEMQAMSDFDVKEDVDVNQVDYAISSSAVNTRFHCVEKAKQ